MAFLDSVKDLGNKTKEEGKKYAEIAKLTGSISSTERQIKEMSARIGEYVVQTGIPEGVEWPDLAVQLAQVKEQYQKIEEMKAAIEQLKAVKEEAPGATAVPGAAGAAFAPKFCTACGKPLVADAAFCMNCGKPVE